MRKTTQLGVLCWCVLMIAQGAHAARTDADRDWTAFRRSEKYHIQTIAISTPHADGSRTLIVSEPPPHVTLDGFAAIDHMLAGAVARKHPIGHQGWVKDIVVDLPALETPALERLVSRLHEYLFFTSYKSTALDLARPPTTATRRFDLVVRSDELKRWMLDPKTQLRPLLGGPAAGTMRQVLDSTRRGVFFSEPAGLVIWVVPKGEDLARRRAEAREFAVDSDIIVGAISSKSATAIVARERVASIHDLPPLRVETIMLLASVETDELAQSYERNHFAAGKFDERTSADWAPIYLSDELIDTEYGSLLNITDQLLKGWSLNGTVTYDNFNYPQPTKWPFPKPLFQMLEAPELTFNWNTKGVGYAVDGGSVTVLAVARTGALPVSYIPEGGAGSRAHSLTETEDTAYQYFASTSDPNLARVVQYAALYQVFRRFGIHATAPQSPVHLSLDAFVDDVEDILIDFVTATPEEVKQRFEALSKSGALARFEEIKAGDSTKGYAALRSLLGRAVERWGPDVLYDLAERMSDPRAEGHEARHVYERLAALDGTLSEADRDRLDTELSSAEKTFQASDAPGTVISRLSPADRKALALDGVAREITRHRSLVRVLTGTSVEWLKTEYEAANERPERGWIRTPPVVVSFTTQALFSGGHNLGAAVVEVRASADVRPGTVRLVDADKQRVLLYNPVDSNYPHELTRVLGRIGNGIRTERLQEAINEYLVSVPRVLPPRPQGGQLGFAVGQRPQPSRGFQEAHAESAIRMSGFRTTTQALTPQQTEFLAAVARDTPAAAVIERRSPTSIMIFNGRSGHVLEATDTSGMVDALTQIAAANRSEGQPAAIVFKGGFSPDETEQIIGSLRLKAETDTIVHLDVTPEVQLNKWLRAGEYEFGEAKVVKVSEITDRDGRRGLDITAEVRPRIASGNVFGRLFLRFRVMFGRAIQVTETLKAEAQAIVQDTLRSLRLTAESFSAYRAAARADAALRKRFGNDAVHVIIEQAKDNLVVQVLRPHRARG